MFLLSFPSMTFLQEQLSFFKEWRLEELPPRRGSLKFMTASFALKESSWWCYHCKAENLYLSSRLRRILSRSTVKKTFMIFLVRIQRSLVAYWLFRHHRNVKYLRRLKSSRSQEWMNNSRSIIIFNPLLAHKACFYFLFRSRKTESDRN